MAKKKPDPTPVESIRHKDKRANIPTEELRDFVADDEHAPKTMLYPKGPPGGLSFPAESARETDKFTSSPSPLMTHPAKVRPASAFLNVVGELNFEIPSAFVDFAQLLSWG